jgi:hypothetical protein
VYRWNNCVCSLSWYIYTFTGAKPEQLQSWYAVELTLYASLGLQAQCIVAIYMNLTTLYYLIVCLSEAPSTVHCGIIHEFDNTVLFNWLMWKGLKMFTEAGHYWTSCPKKLIIYKVKWSRKPPPVYGLNAYDYANSERSLPWRAH